VWGVPIVSLVFAAANIPMLLRHGLDAESKKDVVSEAPVE
jgi:intracellular septation protein